MISLLYIAQVILVVLAGLILYHKGLKPLKWIFFSRIWLFILIPFALGFPIAMGYFSFSFSPVEEFAVILETLTIGAGEIQQNTHGKSMGFPIWAWTLTIAYLLGLGYFIYNTASNIFQLNDKLKQARELESVNGTSVFTYSGRVPFTFLWKIYIPASIDPNSIEYRMILAHELTHVKKHHWADNLWLLFWSNLLWFFPLVKNVKEALQEVHEIQADEKVIRDFDRITYIHFLVSRLNKGVPIELSNPAISPIISKTIKNRIMMMTNKKYNRRMSTAILAISAVFIAGLGLLSCNGALDKQPLQETEVEAGDLQKTSSSDETHSPRSSSGGVELDGEVFQVVEEMPRFPGCEDLSDRLEKENCASMKMMEFVFQNITYPEAARESGIQGTVVVSFVVDRNGNLVNRKVVRDIDELFGDEALRILELMDNMDEKWIPGRQRDRTVNVQYNLPLRFTLDD